MEVEKKDNVVEGIVVEGVKPPAAADGLEAQARAQEEQDAAVAAAADKGKAGEKVAAKTEQEKQQAAILMAAGAVVFLEKGIQSQIPYYDMGDEQRGKLVGAAALVLAKHGGDVMPAWLLPYQEEAKFFAALGGAAFGVWAQVQKHNKEIAIELEKQRLLDEQRARGQAQRGADAGGGAPVGPSAPTPQPGFTPQSAAEFLG